MKTLYVEFDFPGLLFPNTSLEKINSAADVVWPKGAYAYRILERTEVDHCGEKLLGQFKRIGSRHIRGEKWSYERIEKEVGEGTLLSNLKNNYPDTKFAVKCPAGNWQPLLPDDVFESVKG